MTIRIRRKGEARSEPERSEGNRQNHKAVVSSSRIRRKGEARREPERSEGNRHHSEQSPIFCDCKK